MSLNTKQSLAHQMEKALSEILPAPQVSETIRILMETLGGYDVEQIETPEEDTSGEEYLEAFLAAKQIEGKSPKTVERYGYMIRRMLASVKVKVSEITIYHLRSYLTAEKNRGIADRTLEGCRSIYASFFGWLAQEGLISRNPATNLRRIK